mmetsp:Transcript_20560/g.31201  ORF Transcript_20560/g.31201 Transcript_20560/m.31201 type:complete len:217 (-) Transcript_20560:388-1038(-)
MPLLGLLESLDPFIVVNSLGLTHAGKHVLNSRHHSLKSAEVHVSTSLKLAEDLISVLLNLILDVHLASLLVLLLTREGIVQTEVLRETSLGILELVIVKEGVAVGNSKEQPRLTLVHIGSRSLLHKEPTHKSTEGSNSSSSRNHDVISGGVLLRHEHDLTRGSSHLHLVTWSSVAEEVGADTLLRWIISLELRAPVGGTTDAKGSSGAGHIISVTG